MRCLTLCEGMAGRRLQQSGRMACSHYWGYVISWWLMKPATCVGSSPDAILTMRPGMAAGRRNKIANGPETPGPQGPYSTAPAFMFLFPTRRGPAACSSDDAAFKPQPPLEVLCTMQPIWSLVLLTTERPSASYDAGTVPQSNCIIPRQYLA